MVRWRCVDLRVGGARRYAVDVSEWTIGKWLRKMELTRLQPRPFHPKRDEAAQAAFEKLRELGGKLTVPENITLLPLPPFAPALDPMENVWEYLRQNKLCVLVRDTYDALVRACQDAWRFLVDDPARIQSIGNREWPCVNV